MANTSRTSGGSYQTADPEGNMFFSLEVGGVEIAQFMECSGLKTSTTVFEIEEGGLNQYVHKLPGQSRWENIVLRVGVTSDAQFLEWRDEVLQDEFSERRNGAIIVRNNMQEEVRRYSFKNAWPVAWEGPTLNSNGADMSIEMLEIAHHGIEVS